MLFLILILVPMATEPSFVFLLKFWRLRHLDGGAGDQATDSNMSVSALPRSYSCTLKGYFL